MAEKHKTDELIEIVIDTDEIVELRELEEQREKIWREINKSHIKDILVCKDCVWGIQDMEEGYPTYCYCFYGQQHMQPQFPPWYAQWGSTIVEICRNIFKN
jgi:hypothetical protein